MTRPKVFVLAPSNMTVPASGPNGLIGDRVHQTPTIAALLEEHRDLLLWPDDVVTRAFFSRPGIHFVAGRTAAEVVRALEGQGVEEIFALYSPVDSTSPDREADVEILRVAEAIARGLSGTRLHQPSVIDPLGETAVWRQLWDSFPRRTDWKPLPWLQPAEKDVAWARDALAGAFPSWTPGDLFTILSPFSGSPKKAVPDSWWQEFIRLQSHLPTVIPIYGDAEREKARLLFGGTSALIIEADLGQTMAFASLPKSEVIGIDGGRLNVLAASRKSKVYAFYGIWPASAWALPNTESLPLNSHPEKIIERILKLQTNL